ncbi:hypothetical protein [Vallitalea longa]|uniref:hypothetical protein n=1 Tax=Vallitalea longa TaxID=2936439 RepID=UPI002491BEAD|nr:hypothetical protein [Vallitalea longa]
MKKKILLVVLFLLFIIILYGYICNNYSNDGILNNVKKGKRYKITQVQEIPIELFIKPEWIPLNSDEEIKGKVLLELYESTIVLNVTKSNKLFFEFKIKQNMNYNGGQFIYSAILHEDNNATVTSPMLILTNKNKKKIDVSYGIGNSNFAFDIKPENYKDIEEGFYVDYKYVYLHNYVKKF